MDKDERIKTLEQALKVAQETMNKIIEGSPAQKAREEAVGSVFISWEQELVSTAMAKIKELVG